MSGKNASPRERLERVAAVVFACLRPGELRIVLLPSGPCGLARGQELDIPFSIVPFELRMPNTPLWVQFDEDLNAVRVWGRIEGDYG
jgi:hypothetical protein